MLLLRTKSYHGINTIIALIVQFVDLGYIALVSAFNKKLNRIMIVIKKGSSLIISNLLQEFENPSFHRENLFLKQHFPLKTALKSV